MDFFGSTRLWQITEVKLPVKNRANNLLVQKLLFYVCLQIFVHLRIVLFYFSFVRFSSVSINAITIFINECFLFC